MANGHGGQREGAGRKRRPAFQDDGKLLPLDLILSVVRDTEAPMASRLEQARHAAPYCHARLAQTDIDVQGDLNIYKVSQLADLPADPDAT